MITKEEVEHIAKLARLELTEKEIEKMQKDLSAILDYVNLLKKAPRAKEEHSNILKNVGMLDLDMMRKDEAVSQKREVVQKIIQASPDKKDDFIKVKSIL